MIFRISILLSCLVLTVPSANLKAEKIVLDRIVASVDREAISESDINARLEIQKRYNPSADSKSVLEQLVIEKLVWQEARAHKIKISDAEVDNYLGLLAKGQGLSKEAFLKQRIDESYSEESFKEQIKVEIAKQKLIGKLFQNSLDVDESEIDKHLENNPQLNDIGNKIRLRVIFLNKEKHPLDKLLELDKQIQKKLAEGQDFAALAQAHSDDRSAANGGDIGMVSEEDLNSDFFDALLSVKDNGYSKSIVGDKGIHILKVEQRFTNQNDDKSNLREFVKNKLKQEKLQKKIAEYFTSDIQQRHLVEMK